MCTGSLNGFFRNRMFFDAQRPRLPSKSRRWQNRGQTIPTSSTKKKRSTPSSNKGRVPITKDSFEVWPASNNGELLLGLTIKERQEPFLFVCFLKCLAAQDAAQNAVPLLQPITQIFSSQVIQVDNQGCDFWIALKAARGTAPLSTRVFYLCPKKCFWGPRAQQGA